MYGKRNNMGESEKRSFLRRFLSGCVLFILVVAAVLLSRYSFLALLCIICVGSMSEFYRIAGSKGTEPQKVLGTISGILVIASSFMATLHDERLILPTIAIFLCLVILLLFFIVFIAELFRKKENPFANIAATLCGIIYIGVPLSLLNFISIGTLPHLLGGPYEYMAWTVLCYIFVIWSNDIGAYLAGARFGRHKMFPRISPKKTWEGFAGGLVAAVGIAILSGWLLGQSIAFWAGLGLVTVIFGVFGDLVESLIKRSAGLKDSGAIMPGHGGWLDRFDSLLIATPFVFVYFIIFALL